MSGPCVPQDPGYIACGSVCCASSQYCAFPGTCLANSSESTTSSNSPSQTPTGTTSSGISTADSLSTSTTLRSSTSLATSTSTSTAGLTSATSTSGLKPGAIAGISIAAVVVTAALLAMAIYIVVLRKRKGATGSDSRVIAATPDDYDPHLNKAELPGNYGPVCQRAELEAPNHPRVELDFSPRLPREDANNTVVSELDDASRRAA
ncbi:hypothetical protein F5B22DRAFT_622956 [Xylaria bambusicola]|uniref:uncharacterized protein n=1 Tax=Xylaria bambusicola TaxID=326684 RepID=UPI0020086B69|nr:uncharacterized protein F5B22DRAFT_622956 [Xylaria bambusicola]KAI0506701.1 hypothetical protein F5B22DRAFT_622956 [Xylaria bambusicola]